MLQEHFPRGSELDVPARPLEQSRPELPLQLCDCLRERRLRDVQALCCAAEVELLAEDGEVPKLAKLERGSIRVRGRLSQVTFAEGVQRDLLLCCPLLKASIPTRLGARHRRNDRPRMRHLADRWA